MTCPARRSGFLHRGGTACAIASRTIRRCTPSFRATPRIVPTPNSYSRRISSYNSTLALQFNCSLRLRFQSRKSKQFPLQGWGQIKVPKGANSEYRNQLRGRTFLGHYEHDLLLEIGLVIGTSSFLAEGPSSGHGPAW